jgi:hypothetical protein
VGAYGFVDAVNSSARTELIAVMGATEKGKIYVHTRHGHGDSAAEVKTLSPPLIAGGPPTKDTPMIARLSRSEMVKRVASGMVTDQKLLAALSEVPENVQTFFCRMTKENYMVTWDEPNLPQAGQA